MTPQTKEYRFSLEEVCILRDAMADLKHHLTPTEDAIAWRKRNYRLACALLEQFTHDARVWF